MTEKKKERWTRIREEEMFDLQASIKQDHEKKKKLLLEMEQIIDENKWLKEEIKRLEEENKRLIRKRNP